MRKSNIRYACLAVPLLTQKDDRPALLLEIKPKVKLGSDSPLFSYFLVGGINESDLLRRERDKFWRHAARNHLIGMIFSITSLW